MIIGGNKRTVRSKYNEGVRQIKIGAPLTSCDYSAYLLLYTTPPGEDITLAEFDEIAVERLKTLKALENCKDSFKFNEDDFKKAFREQTRFSKLLINHRDQLSEESDIKDSWRRDVIGHFILRLAFCRTPENVKWLVNQEIDFFRFRFLNESKERIQRVLRNNQLNFDVVGREERDSMAEDICNGSGLEYSQLAITDFFKVHFTDALDLVRKRQVYLKDGFAYVPFEDLVVILTSQLRVRMTAAMARAYKNLGILEEEGRLLPRLRRLANNAYDGKQYTSKENEAGITRHMLNELAAKSFPPCMKQLHTNLRANHHLKYGGRRQYGLFLKALGLSLDEAILFMREEFTKKIPSDKFDKEYGYNIRYMYGKEGKRIAQSAFSCSAIILRNPPSAMDCHGCPFRHTEPQILAQRLQKDGLNKEQIDKIVGLSSQFGYDKACTRFFEYTHKMEEGALGQLITHPNQYFDESQKVLSGQRSMVKDYEQSQVMTAKIEPKVDDMDDDFDMDDLEFIAQPSESLCEKV